LQLAQQTLISIFKKKDKIEDSEQTLASDDSEGEVADEVPSENPDTRKKAKSSDSDDIKRLVEIKIDELKVHVDSKFESLVVSSKSAKNKVTEKNEKTEEELANKITHCTNIPGLETLF
jgi:hypothetical protein